MPVCFVMLQADESHRQQNFSADIQSVRVLDPGNIKGGGSKTFASEKLMFFTKL